VDKTQAQALTKDQELLDVVTTDAKHDVMGRVAVLPAIMAICYLCLILYFKARGGYKAIDLMAEKGGH
jgi:MFS transporter, DHA2 family, metal-tetracycline-proton antiporter